MTVRTNYFIENQVGLMPKQVDQSFSVAMQLMREHPKYKNYTQTRIAKELGITQGYVGKIYRGEKKGTEEVRRRIAALFGFDGSKPGKTYDDFLNIGRNSILIEESKRPDRKPVHSDTQTVWSSEPTNNEALKIKPIQQDHKCLIDAFLDQKTAYDINKKLLDLEKHDPEKYKAIKSYIDYLHDQLGAKKIAGENSE